MRSAIALILICWAATAASGPNIDWFMSDTNKGESYLLVDDCFVPIKNDRLKDQCYVQKQIEKECHIKDALGEKCG